MSRKKFLKMIAILFAIILLFNVVRTIYIDILSYRTSSETINNSLNYFSKIKKITEKCGYSMNSTEPFDGAGTYEKAFKFRSDNFEFSVCIANWHDALEQIYVYFYNNQVIDYEIILKVFNTISACNISKNKISQCCQKINRGKDYERNLILFSDKCSIYGSSENKSICITGVPGLGF